MTDFAPTPEREGRIQSLIRLAVSKTGARLFRNNRGMFLTLDGKRKVRAGLSAAGSSDLIGWMPVTVTEDMVGKQVAIFAAVEVKGTGRPSKDQRHFIEVVCKAGGIAGVARSEDEAVELLGSVY